MEKCIVTGVSGFIGRHLVKRLIHENIFVYGLVREYCPDINNPLVRQILYKDAHELLELTDVLAFFHLAWGGVGSSLKNDLSIQMDNIKFSMEMLTLASKIQCRVFIGVGTVAEYALCNDILDVNIKQTPNDIYGAAKVSTHYLLDVQAKLLKQPFIWAVLPSTFGEGRCEDNIITYTIKELLCGKKPVYGKLEQLWDFLYIEEVVRALFLISLNGKDGTTYGIGSGIFRPLKEYIIKIRDIIDPSLPLGIGELNNQDEKAISACVGIYKVTKDTGFIPEIDFDEGINITINSYRKTISGKKHEKK